VHDYLKPKKTGFEQNQYRNFGFEKSSGIPVLKALIFSQSCQIDESQQKRIRGVPKTQLP
jgi:hypothetical protein